MPESNPNPTRLTDPAAIPAATATTPSMPFHEIVATFSHRARRTAAARSTGRAWTCSATGTDPWT